VPILPWSGENRRGIGTLMGALKRAPIWTVLRRRRPAPDQLFAAIAKWPHDERWHGTSAKAHARVVRLPGEIIVELLFDQKQGSPRPGERLQALVVWIDPQERRYGYWSNVVFQVGPKGQLPRLYESRQMTVMDATFHPQVSPDLLRRCAEALRRSY
jgi:hypothetical protein